MGFTPEEYEQLLRNQSRTRAQELSPGVAHIMPAKRNKYGVAPKEERTVDGIVFASKKEANAYAAIVLAIKAGSMKSVELQPRFEFPCGVVYVADFRITYPDGTVAIVDVKGLRTPVFKIKQKLLKYFNPEVNLLLW